MRRVSLALALVGALAATGCGGGAKKSSNSGTAPGVAEGTFKVFIQNGQAVGVTGQPGYMAANPALRMNYGKVESTSPAGSISCGAGITGDSGCVASFPLGTTVVLKGTPVGADKKFIGWAGDCTAGITSTGSVPDCTLTGNSDKYVVALFGDSITSHPNWSDKALHGPAYFAQTIRCTDCHGAKLQGVGIAVSCFGCHQPTMPPLQPTTGHFDATATDAGGNTHGAWSSYVTVGSPPADRSACWRCHSVGGFRDYIGDLGARGTIAAPYDTYAYPTNIPASGTLTCGACHNTAAAALTTYELPSGTVVTTSNSTAICGQCHGARESTVSMNTLIGATLDDVTIPAANFSAVGSTANGFVNPHYLGAAATMQGGNGQGWYQYAHKVYTGPNQHGKKADCTFCHDAHTGALPAEGDAIAAKCGSCHANEANTGPIRSITELEEVRQYGFEGDIDGDGVIEPLNVEIADLAAKVEAGIKAYASTVVGTSICFSDSANPYFFKDNGKTQTTSVQAGIANDGICQADEANRNNAYNVFTPRLERAAFNLKWAHADPGAWAHNPRYAIEVLYDTLEDLNSALADAAKIKPVFADTAFARSFAGHFGGVKSEYVAAVAKWKVTDFPAGGDAFTDWNPAFNTETNAWEGGAIGSKCAQCHAGETGLVNYLANPTNSSPPTPPSITGFECTTCHVPAAADANFKTMRAVTTLYFPPAKSSSQRTTIAANTVFPKAGDRVCATCHSGREGTLSVDAKIGSTPDTDWTTLTSFTNPHYLGAAGMMLGSNAKMMYQYTGKTYTATPVFWQSNMASTNGPYGSPHAQSCTSCHNPQGSKHSFEVDLATTVPSGTYKGAVNTQSCKGCHDAHVPGGLEAVRAEYEERALELYNAITAYSQAQSHAMCYNGASHPYWYVDNNANGVCDSDDTVATPFNPTALKAAFNYKWTQAEPGAWAHNEYYVFEVIFDSIVDLGFTPTFVVGAPGKPTLVMDTTNVVLTWTAPDRAPTGTTYTVQRAEADATDSTKAGTYSDLAPDLSVLTYTDTTAATGTKYFYRVLAVKVTTSGTSTITSTTTSSGASITP